MNTEITLRKPNELIATIEQIKVGRLAKHLLNYFYKHAQTELRNNPSFEGNVFTLNIAETNDLAEIHSKNYCEIQAALEKLIMPVTVKENERLSKNQIKDLPSEEQLLAVITTFSPISQVSVIPKLGIYRFELCEKVLHLLKTVNYYTTLDLKEFNPLVGKHSINIFEWLKRYESLAAKNSQGKTPILTVSELKELTHTKDKKTYDNIAAIERRILIPAVEEINKLKKDDKQIYMVSYELLKERTAATKPKVTKIQFYFKNLLNGGLVSNKNTVPQNKLKLSDILNKGKFEIDNLYAELCKKYITCEFCNNETEFIEATYTFTLETLECFFNAKKSYHSHEGQPKLHKIDWLWDSFKNPDAQFRIYPRAHTKNNVFYDLVAEAIQINPDAREIISAAKKTHGFGSVVLRLRMMLNYDNSDIKDYY